MWAFTYLNVNDPPPVVVVSLHTLTRPPAPPAPAHTGGQLEHSSESLSSLRFAEKVGTCEKVTLCGKCGGNAHKRTGGKSGKGAAM
jgi:hypothetical protein